MEALVVSLHRCARKVAVLLPALNSQTARKHGLCLWRPCCPLLGRTLSLETTQREVPLNIDSEVGAVQGASSSTCLASSVCPTTGRVFTTALSPAISLELGATR